MTIHNIDLTKVGINMQQDYLGDGVYVSFDGYQIELKTEGLNGHINIVYLEPNVFNNLTNYAKKVFNYD